MATWQYREDEEEAFPIVPPNLILSLAFSLLVPTTPVGNRATAAGQPYVPNRLNQYTAVGATTLRYDLNGNVTFDGTMTYVYDSENRLISANRGGMTATYAYDPLNRRASKTVNGVTTSFLYDGDQLIADLDANGKVMTRYVYGPGIDEPLVMFRAGKSYYFHADGLGSVVALTDSRGQLVERYAYSAFGTPVFRGVPQNSVLHI